MASRFTLADGGKVVGAKLRQARLMLGITQKELAKRTGVERSQISKIERGSARTINPHVQMLCIYLHIDTDGRDTQPEAVTSLGERLQRLAERSPELMGVLSAFIDVLETVDRHRR